MQRRTELRIAATAIGIAILFTFAVSVGWLPWWPTLPPVPVMHGWDAFALYAWIDLVLPPLVVIALVVAIVRRYRGFIPFSLVAIIAAAAVALVVPFYASYVTRVDRVRGLVEEPLRIHRLYATLFIVTLALNVLLIAITRQRRTPPMARVTPLVTFVVVCALYLHFFWLIVILPFGTSWRPTDWERTDRLRSVRPCHGAILWATLKHPWPVARIDGLWLRFADPRRGGAEERAISAVGEFREQYDWLTMRDLESLRVRTDDPAVIDCDGIWRRERVAPAPWHHIGRDW